MDERINLAKSQNEIVRNLRHTRARTKFINRTGSLSLVIYKYEPHFHLEIVKDGENSIWADDYVKARDRIKKLKEARI